MKTGASISIDNRLLTTAYCLFSREPPSAARGRNQSLFSRQDAKIAKKTLRIHPYSWRLVARHNAFVFNDLRWSPPEIFARAQDSEGQQCE
ncbi:MAG: hypothetical protein FJ280_11720 [Planctomycetes bacterium]|nr:hypothetical protein [Planctomycetota bacterium]